MHPKMESKLGPSRLQVLSRGLITPTASWAEEHHLQGTNLLGEFKRIGEEQVGHRSSRPQGGAEGREGGGEAGRDEQERRRRPEPILESLRV